MSDVVAPITFRALGTTAGLLVTDPAAAGLARQVLERQVRAIDDACSRFRPDSELARVNAAAGAPVEVSPLFLDALEVALRAARLTTGRVDPTVGAALRILGYDRDFSSVDPDGPPLRTTVRPVPGWRLVRVDHRASTVRIPTGVELDFGATAKALCADRAARAAADATGAGVLISLGGDIAVSGPTPPGGWCVRVTDDHASPVDAEGQTVLIGSGGLATSGTSVRHWARGSHQLHHLVDPTSGWPAPACWRTVSVTAGSCVDANTASTAAIILGPDAPMWLEERHLPSRLVATDGRVICVGGWPETEDGSPC
jgi:thiamine biosynthesis lipoprotein